MLRHRTSVLIGAVATLGACAGWEGPSNWLSERFAVGEPSSVCAASTDVPQAEYAAEHQLQTDPAGWRAGVRAQEATCIVHTDPFGMSRAAWVECRVQGPALITHTPPINGAEAFVAGPSAFDLRMTRRGMSCRPISAG